MNELQALTGRLIEDRELRRRMDVAARERSRAFGRDAFEARLWGIIGR